VKKQLLRGTCWGGPLCGEVVVPSAAQGKVFYVHGHPGGRYQWAIDGSGRWLYRVKRTPIARAE